jgi:hypothetical protein
MEKYFNLFINVIFCSYFLSLQISNSCLLLDVIMYVIGGGTYGYHCALNGATKQDAHKSGGWSFWMDGITDYQ